MEKRVLLILVFLAVALIVLNGCDTCYKDSDCSVNDCCNPTSCIKTDKAPQCQSILVCPAEPPQVSCKCVNNKCSMQQ